ncbi:hypothetical protein C8J57DRAFT_1231155 [Mycena rebaudengoi]|nr:hypothetical protein C8J57DRAFT_1250498 [Mycena rebaudengoi]KAJ7263279.1 hypothetical protein C8J57DRAFT_1231155 [Mycena rebaudengoi]
MREVRKDGASGTRAKFRKAWAALQREKAEMALKRREKTASRKKLAASKLAATELELNISTINSLSSARLKEQLQVYKNVLKDEVLVKTLWKEMGTVGIRRKMVLEALARELERRKKSDSSLSESLPDSSEVVIIEEYGFSPTDDAEWEDDE